MSYRIREGSEGGSADLDYYSGDVGIGDEPEFLWLTDSWPPSEITACPSFEAHRDAGVPLDAMRRYASNQRASVSEFGSCGIHLRVSTAN